MYVGLENKHRSDLCSYIPRGRMPFGGKYTLKLIGDPIQGAILHKTCISDPLESNVKI